MSAAEDFAVPFTDEPEDEGFTLAELSDWVVNGGRTTREHLIVRLVAADRDAVWQALNPGLSKAESAMVEMERLKLRSRRLAQEQEEALRLGGSTEAQTRMTDGGSFILDLPPEMPSVWGAGKAVVWAQGEALTITGPTGVGKTTLAGQVIRGRLIGGSVLGMPVTPTESAVLYLAMDRPQQIARALARVLGDMDRDVLEERLIVWPGPPMKDVATHPETLLEMARRAGADTVVVDSLKDAAIGLTKDEVGAGYNRARQLCLAHGVEVLELHHTVKSGAEGKEPSGLEHVYGSAWLTAGSGSVVSLFGKAGDPVVRWRHLKQPAEEVGPFDVEHNHDAGTSQIYGDLDLTDEARRAGKNGLTAKGVATLMFENSKPTKAEIMKATRRLDAMVREGTLTRRSGEAATQTPTTWHWSDPSEDFGEPDPDDLL